MCESAPRLEENAISKGITFMEQFLLLDRPAAERVSDYLEARFLKRIEAKFNMDAAPAAEEKGTGDGRDTIEVTSETNRSAEGSQQQLYLF